MKRFLAAMVAALLMVGMLSGAAVAAKPAPAPAFTTGLTVDGAQAAGSYNGGFFVPITGVSGSYVWLYMDNTVAVPDLTLMSTTAANSNGLNYPFYLKAGAGQQATLKAYFAAKGWPTNYLAQIDSEIAGTAPFFYLNYWPLNPCYPEDPNCNGIYPYPGGTKVGDGGYETWDGFSYWYCSNLGWPYECNLGMRVDNDYPVGTYQYVAGNPVILPAGTLAPAGSFVPLSAKVKMKVILAP